VDAAANEALIQFLAKILDCPNSSVTILRGHTSRHKTIRLNGLEEAQVRRQLDT
jgi:uncharacterized protein YggU (UPF0235/DUF167 family)